MTVLPLLLATALYVWQAVALAFAHQYGLAFTFLGYSVANLGLMWAARGS